MDVGQVQVIVQGQFWFVCQWVVVVYGVDVVVFYQFDVVYLGIGVQWCVDGEVEVVGGEFFGGFVVFGEEVFDMYVWCQVV